MNIPSFKSVLEENELLSRETTTVLTTKTIFTNNKSTSITSITNEQKSLTQVNTSINNQVNTNINLQVYLVISVAISILLITALVVMILYNKNKKFKRFCIRNVNFKCCYYVNNNNRDENNNIRNENNNNNQLNNVNPTTSQNSSIQNNEQKYTCKICNFSHADKKCVIDHINQTHNDHIDSILNGN